MAGAVTGQERHPDALVGAHGDGAARGAVRRLDSVLLDVREQLVEARAADHADVGEVFTLEHASTSSGSMSGGFGCRDSIAQRGTVRRLVDALLGDDGRDVPVWRDVERGMSSFHALGRDPLAGDVRHLVRRALLDRDLVAAVRDRSMVEVGAAT